MRIQNILAATAVLVAGLFSTAEAAPITYKLQGQMDATVNGTPVTGVFVWTVTGDTASLSMLFPGVFMVPALSNSIDVSGFGTLIPTAPFFVFFQPGVGQDGFIATNFVSGISFIRSLLVAYTGTSSIGPLGVSPLFAGALATDKGTLSIDNTTGLVFQAVVAGSTVPEPLTLTLFGAGLAGLGAIRRRKQKA